MKKELIKYTTCLLLSMMVISCKKQFLDKKSSSALTVPTTIEDLKLLLINPSDIRKSPALGELSSDDYYMGKTEWTSQFLPYFSNSYVWSTDIYQGTAYVSDWDVPYKQVLYANVVLDGLENIQRNPVNADQYDDLKGSALFMRAYSFFDLAQVFAPPYDAQSARVDFGIPLRTTADIGAKTVRATIEETYQKILNDLDLAGQLIKDPKPAINGYMPSKLSVFALKARVYLTMRDYSKAGIYADSALLIKSDLINYNTLSTTANLPFTVDHVESIFQNYLVTANPITNVTTSQGYSIDTLLYSSYHTNDLRKVIFFSVNGKFINKKRGYSGNLNTSNGLAIDELYLIRAECAARVGQDRKAFDDLNLLLTNRFKTGTFVPLVGLSSSDLLIRILQERRKELVFRGLRWNDLRRLNKEGYNIIVKRILGTETFTLQPNSPQYTLPIPPGVISLTGIEQNQR